MNAASGGPILSHKELVAVVLVLAAGGVLRWAHLERVAVEHFDEGVYASNLMFDAEDDYRYPNRELYAPPLLPWAIEWSVVVFGPARWAPIMPSMLAGTLTVAVVWWIGRSWFNPAAGLAAALLAALSDFHVLYSRTALTDVLLGLWLLLAIHAFWLAVRRERIGLAVLAGLLTGLAWATKYNGWLPAAITAAGLAAWSLDFRPSRSRLGIAWRMLGTAVLTAACAWFPLWLDLQDYGGYAAVAANHRQYVVGLEGWWSAAVRQWENLRYLDGWVGVAGVALAVLVPAVAASRPAASTGRRPTLRRWLFIASAAVCLAGAAAWLGTASAIGMAAAFGIGRMISSRQLSDNRLLAAWLLAAWFGGMLLATPLYQPYPRLTLPWLAAAWLGSGAAIGGVVGAADRERVLAMRNRVWQLFGGLLLVASAGLLLLASGRLTRRGVPAWQPRTGLADCAQAVADDAGRLAVAAGHPPDEVFLYVYAEPALFHHLRRLGLELVGPVQSLSFLDDSHERPVFLAVGPRARRSEPFQAQRAQRPGALETVNRIGYRPSDLVLLDEFAPAELEERALVQEEVELLWARD